jgi:catechol 2,3-dioxygenase-like lactoylglutathione lyase family enzyme
MAIRLNHTIVAAHDKDTSATFLTKILGLPAPSLLSPFAVVRVGDTSLDYIDANGEITPQHYAFLVSEIEFDEIFERIRERRLPYWADPGRHERDQINAWDDGRGLYFDDPNGHLLEIIPVRMAAVVRRRPDLTPWSRRHWIPQITRAAALVIKGRTVGAASPLRSDPTRDE